MEGLKAELETPSSTERAFSIEVPREHFDKIFDSKAKKYSKELRLNGYRKGSIPKRIVVERFREPLTSETLEKLVEDVVREVCDEHKIQPVAPGKVQELKNEGEAPIHLKVTVEVDPEVDFTDYKNLGVALEKVTPVTDREVEVQLKQYLESLAEEKPSEKPGRDGDVVLGEYLSVEVDGKPDPLQGDKSFRIVIGADQIPEFNEAFRGVKPAEEKEIEVNYPKDYNVAELAGKTGRFTVRINEVKERILPELDDALAKKLGAESLQALKDSLKMNLEKNREQAVRTKAHSQAIQKVLERHPFEVPNAKIERFLEYRHEQEHGNHHDHDHHHHHNDDPKQREEAAYQLKRHRIVEEISKKEKIKATQTEVDERVESLAKQYGVDFDTLKASLRKSGKINDIRYEIKTEKTLDFLAGLSVNS